MTENYGSCIDNVNLQVISPQTKMSIEAQAGCSCFIIGIACSLAYNWPKLLSVLFS